LIKTGESLKQSTEKKGEKLQDGRTQVLANKKSSKEGRPLRKHEQIKYLTPSLVARSIPDKEKGGTLERTPS
jgi:hypothetical protein